jgi:large subunit ribosomal protein L11
MEIKLLVDGGAMKPGPALSQKMGPLGMNLGKIISEINKVTQEFTGMKVPVTLDINTKTKDFKVQVSTPPTSALLKKELSIEKGSAEPNNIKIGNLPIETIIKIAKVKERDMIVNGLKAAINNVLGTCVSLGILVESKDAREIIKEIQEGKHDEIISKGVEEASQEKLQELGKEFIKVQKAQEAYIKSLEAKKEAKAAAAAAPGATPAEGAAPAGAATVPVATPAVKETKEDKKKKK